MPPYVLQLFMHVQELRILNNIVRKYPSNSPYQCSEHFQAHTECAGTTAMASPVYYIHCLRLVYKISSPKPACNVIGTCIGDRFQLEYIYTGSTTYQLPRPRDSMPSNSLTSSLAFHVDPGMTGKSSRYIYKASS